MAEEKSTIQSTIDKVASGSGEDPASKTQSSEDGGVEGTESQTTKDGQPAPEQGSEGKDQGSEQKKGGEKSSAAFAAMRKRISELETQLKEANDNKASTQENQQQQEKQQTDGQEDQGESQKENPEYKALQERLDRLEQERKQEQEQRKMTQTAYELQQLQDQYKLSSDDLYKFADDAQAKGIDLMNTDFSVQDVYNTVYHEQIVQSEVERVKQELQNQEANPQPSSGPRTKSTPKGTGGKSILDTIAEVDKATNK